MVGATRGVVKSTRYQEGNRTIANAPLPTGTLQCSMPLQTNVGSISQGSYGWHSIHSSVFETLQSLQVDEDGGPPCAEGNNGWPYIHDSAFTSLWNSQGVEDGGSLTDADHLEHSAAQDVRPTTCTHDM